jgi:hypothetical protein
VYGLNGMLKEYAGYLKSNSIRTIKRPELVAMLERATEVFNAYDQEMRDAIAAVDGRPGDPGPAGTAGLDGVNGIAGAAGKDGAQGEIGPAGKDGVDGLPGVKGDRGLQGLKGDQGVKGDPGAKGEQGVQGVKGETGSKGDQGIQGIQGAKGDQGIQGIQGAKGDQGTAAINSKIAEFTGVTNALGIATIPITGFTTISSIWIRATAAANAQMVTGVEISRSLTSIVIQGYQAKPLVLLSAGPFEIASAGKTVAITVIGT